MSLPTQGLKSLVFCSSAGHCQLDCEYCVAAPVVKREPSITYEDLRFLLEQLEPPVGLYFSGRGDFFAGYPKRDRFLERVLDHDVLVGLDVNGVLLNEYPELPPAKLAKIRDVNLTLHYGQVKAKRVEKIWVANARQVIERTTGSLLVGTILSPLAPDLWDEALAFYREEVFAPTGKRLWLIRDANRALTPEQEAEVERLVGKYAGMVEKEHVEDFAAAFAGHASVLCPTGRSYYRVWNDGRVDGCMWVGGLTEMGNLKERRLARRDAPFECTTARFCDCWIIRNAGMMEYPQERAAGTVPLAARSGTAGGA